MTADASEILLAMHVLAGQEWELPSTTSGDPVVLKVVQVMDDKASVVTVRRSAPDVVLERSTMWVRDVIDSGVLVRGPGSLGARRRRERVAYLGELLCYQARRHGVSAGPDVRFDGRELVAMVADDEDVTEAVARAMLRQALAALGGTETTSPYSVREITYVIPSVRVRGAA